MPSLYVAAFARARPGGSPVVSFGTCHHISAGAPALACLPEPRGSFLS